MDLVIWAEYHKLSGRSSRTALESLGELCPARHTSRVVQEATRGYKGQNLGLVAMSVGWLGAVLVSIAKSELLSIGIVV